jgi:sterol desaturase/sphingolipid hydroxylase (fatty acid hydroxylase superfamily)
MNVLVNESGIRLASFAALLFMMALWEVVAPRRQLTTRRPLRWASNLAIAALNTLAARILVPVGAVGVPLLAQERGWGLFHRADLPIWLVVTLSVIALDLVIYLQHAMFHAVPLLWRLHMVHHADLDFDATTGARFHTLEILLSLGIKAAAVVLLGAPALAVVLFEVILNATSTFGHGNVCLPMSLDRILRLIVVTPEMHRVHHSVVPRETNSNLGFNLPWWDFLLGTYRSQPAAGNQGMTIGLEQFRDEQQVARLLPMLALPFVGRVGSYPINLRGGKNTSVEPGNPRDAAAGAERPAAEAEIPWSLGQALDSAATQHGAPSGNGLV